MDGLQMLEWLRGRRSTRRFLDRPVPREILVRLAEAATSAPSSSNRQPWRFAFVTDARLREAIVRAVGTRVDEMKTVLRRTVVGEELAGYADFFHEPLQSAATIVIPSFRDYPDQIAHLLSSAGADPDAFQRPATMQPELCGTSAAVMSLLLQARAESLGACWMAGPTVARREIESIVGIVPPYRMLGAVALGYPAQDPPGTSRKPLDRVVTWLDAPEERP